MQLRVARLVAGSAIPAGDGRTGAQRCVITLKDDGSKRAAVLKRGPVGQVAAEAFSALLLRAWGLYVPEPFLVEEDGNLSFASADAGYPNLKHHLGLDALPEGPAREAALLTAMTLACSFSSSTLATACDEAIDNRDRNLGNILWDGKVEAWIDHAFALGQGDTSTDVNKLCLMAIKVGDPDKFQRGAVAQSLLLDRNLPNDAESAILSLGMPPEQFSSYVAARISNLGNRLIARFPRSEDLFPSS